MFPESWHVLCFPGLRNPPWSAPFNDCSVNNKFPWSCFKSLQGVCVIRGAPSFVTSLFKSQYQVLSFLPFFLSFSFLFLSFSLFLPVFSLSVSFLSSLLITEQINPGLLPPLPKHTFPSSLIHLQPWEIPRQGSFALPLSPQPQGSRPPSTPFQPLHPIQALPPSPSPFSPYLAEAANPSEPPSTRTRPRSFSPSPRPPGPGRGGEKGEGGEEGGERSPG